MARSVSARGRIDDLKLLDERRQLLIKVACRFAAKKGFAQTSMDDIADSVGISKASIYNYVGSKEEIIYLTIYNTHRIIADLFDSLRKKHHAGTVSEAMRQSIRAYIECVDGLQDEFNFLNHVITILDTEWRRTLLADTVYVHEYFESMITDGIDRAEFAASNPRVLASMTAGLCSGWAHNRWFLRRIVSREQYVSQVTDVVMGYLSNANPEKAEGRHGVEARPSETADGLAKGSA